MSGFEILVIILLLGLGWFWLSSIHVRELATRAAAGLCKRAQVLFLDDSVVLKRLWVARHHSGRLAFRRCYRFEFASDGSQRYQGRLVMVGERVVASEMDAYRDAPD